MSDTDLTTRRSGRGLGWLLVTALVAAGLLAFFLYRNGYFSSSDEARDPAMPPVIIEAD